MQTGTLDEHDERDGNELAEAAMATWERVRPHLGTIGIAVGLVFAALAGWTIMTAQQAGQRARSWDECFAAIQEGGGPRLDEAVRRHPGTPAAQWCQLLAAESALAEGGQLLFTDPGRGRPRLEEAVGTFAKVLGERPQRMVAERAVLGLAKAREGLGELEAARKGYESIVADYPGGGLEEIAADRAAALGRESTRRWYDWFNSRKPATAPPARSDDTAPRTDATPTTEPAPKPGAGAADAPAVTTPGPGSGGN